MRIIKITQNRINPLPYVDVTRHNYIYTYIRAHTYTCLLTTYTQNEETSRSVLFQSSAVGLILVSELVNINLLIHPFILVWISRIRIRYALV